MMTLKGLRSIVTCLKVLSWFLPGMPEETCENPPIRFISGTYQIQVMHSIASAT